MERINMELVHSPRPPPSPWRTKRVCKTPQKLNLAIENEQDLNVMDVDNPQSYDKAIKSVESKKWQTIMKSEKDSIYFNKVWSLVDALGANGSWREISKHMAVLKHTKLD